MLSKTLSSLLILACVLVLPLLAQTPAPAGAANQTMGTNPATTTTSKKVMKIETTKTVTKTTTKKHHVKSSGGRAHDTATRLAALLADTQGKATLSATTWKSIGNEANALGNKLVAETSGKSHTAAKDACTHVRQMRAAAMKGDADGAKSHAAQALPYVYTVIDATGPKK